MFEFCLLILFCSFQLVRIWVSISSLGQKMLISTETFTWYKQQLMFFLFLMNKYSHVRKEHISLHNCWCDANMTDLNADAIQINWHCRGCWDSRYCIILWQVFLNFSMLLFWFTNPSPTTNSLVPDISQHKYITCFLYCTGKSSYLFVCLFLRGYGVPTTLSCIHTFSTWDITEITNYSESHRWSR